jgi:hypothetical protein
MVPPEALVGSFEIGPFANYIFTNLGCKMMFYDSKKMFYYIIMQMYIGFLKINMSFSNQNLNVFLKY